MKIRFMSLGEAQQITPYDNIALISIHEPNQPTNIDYDKWKHHLVLEFHDADRQTGETRLVIGGEKNIKYFDEAMARGVIKFINDLKSSSEPVDTIYVHCYGGISRSPAVAKFLGDKIFGIDVRATSVYNRYVYSMLEKVWMEDKCS